MREMCRRTPLRKTEHARRFLRRSRERFVRLRFRREPQHPEAITELARKVRQCAGRTRAMPGRTRGDAAVRRVVERLFALTVDDGADERPAATSGDDGQAQIPDAGDHLSARRGASMPPQPPPPSVERTVAALKAAYAEERYADVRAAVVAALPRVPHPARFVLRCIEALAHETRDDADAVGTKTPTRGAPSEPLIHLLLEALGATECVEAVRRPVFAATESGTRLVDPEARADAAALLARTFRGAVHAARAAAADDDAYDEDAFPETRDAFGADGKTRVSSAARLHPRAAARLASVAGIDLSDLEAHDPNKNAHPSVEHALHWYVGACVGAALSEEEKKPKRKPSDANAASRVSAAVRLVRHFSLAAFATPSALDAIEHCGHGALADGVAACLPTRERERYVRRLAERERNENASLYGHVGIGVGAAERAERRMRRMGLPPTFPEQERAREEARLRRLCAQGRWEVADALAGEDPGLRAAMAGLRAERAESNVFGSAFFGSGSGSGSPSPSFFLGAENDAAQPSSSRGEREHAGTTLALDLPSGAVVFADDAQSLRRAVSCLARDEVIGLDTEWRPDSFFSRASKKNKTSLLQLAGRRSAAILDVPSLCLSCAPDAIQEALQTILCEPREWNGPGPSGTESSGDEKKKRVYEPPVVLGFGLAEDLRRAAKSWPASLGRALAAIPKAVCLQTLCASSAVCQNAGLPRLPGLSAAAAHFLGAPLDKTVTCSDWNRRPLSLAQTRYAAQDARVLVRLLPLVLGADTMEEAAEIARDRHAVPAVPAMLADDFFHRRLGALRVADDFFEDEFAAFEFETGPRSTRTTRAEDASEDFDDDDGYVAPLSPSDTAAALAACLAPLGVDPTPIRLPPETGPTAEDTAAALGPDVPVDAVVKSIGVVINGGAEAHRRAERSAGSRSAVAVAAALGAPSAHRAENFSSRPKAVTLTPALLMLRGSDRVDLRAVASWFGVARRKVRLATPEECVGIFGYPPGSMPPIGLRGCASLAAAGASSAAGSVFGSIPALMDAAVHALGSKDVYPGAGAPDLVFRCPAHALAEATRAEVLALAEPGKTTTTTTTTTTEVPGTDPDPPSSERKRFVADGSLGRLARWLRALGVDAEHVPAGAAGEYGALLDLATKEHRVVLTRDRNVLRRREFRDVGVFVVEPDDPKDQLRFVAKRFGLTFQRGRLLTRCAKCNGEVERKLSAEEVAAHPRIPAKVKRAAEDFWSCGRCAKVYWIGPKSHKAMDFIREDLMDMLVSKNTPDFIKETFGAAAEQDQEALVDAAALGDAWPREGDE